MPRLKAVGGILRAAPTSDDVIDLETAAAFAWQAQTTHRLGDWLLRASNGFTGRANSCLPLGEPGVPLEQAVAHVSRWYDRYGLSPVFQLPLPSVPSELIVDHIDAAGWQTAYGAIVMTSAINDVTATGRRSDAPTVRVDDRPDQAWLANYHYRGGELPAHAIDVLIDAETVGFTSIDDEGSRVAVARGAVTTAPSGRRWLGVTAVEVAPHARRRGLGSQIMAGVSQWGRDHGATHVYVQVAPENSGAIATYGQLGFAEHHRYHYRKLART